MDGKNEAGPYLDENSYPWKRATELLENCVIFQDKIEPNDITQGNLGNCYFLSALSSLAKFPELIYKIFRTKQVNQCGYYEIIMFIDGEWQIVIIDDFFPTSSNTGNIAFTRPNGNELWVILLEKAWAKINGGYINIIGGFSYEPLHVLSSFSTKFFYIEFENDLFKKVQSNLNENNIMCISTFNIVGAEAVELERKFGIIVGHAYSLLNAKEGFFNNKQIQLLQLRNPWGRGEWKGNWSDS